MASSLALFLLHRFDDKHKKKRKRRWITYVTIKKGKHFLEHISLEKKMIGEEYIANKHKWIQCAGFLNIEYTILYDLGNDNYILYLYYFGIYAYINIH